MHARRIAAAAVVAAAAAALTGAAIPAQAAPARHGLAHSKPNWLGKATRTGDVPGSSQVDFSVLLKLRGNPDAAIQQLSDPSSANYGKWLTNKQFRAQYAPTSGQVAAVKSWLKSNGFAIDETFPSGMLVEAHGTAAGVEKTFGTQLANFNFRGHTVHANTTTLSLPSDTSATALGAIDGIVGLDQGSALKTPADKLPPPSDGSRYGVEPCSSYFGQLAAGNQPTVDGASVPYAVCGYGPQQLQSAYGVTSQLNNGIDGKGITVAITDAYASPTILNDANTYAKSYGQPVFGAKQFSQITPKKNKYGLIDECGGNGWYGEETLDVEAVHSMAPGAKVVYVGGADCSTGLDTAWASTIDNHVADVITNSWTDGVDDLADLGQAYVDFYTQFSQEAALTGITVSFSTGDSGDHTAGNTDPGAKTAEFPADSPYVTGVGGTSLEVGDQGQWLGEYGWQNAYAPLQNGAWGSSTYSSGGGGGVSQLFHQPPYQTGVVPDSIASVNGLRMRTLPDIALEGDPNTGMRVGQTQVFPDGTYYDTYRIGGTSLSSPLFAGVMAVAGQAAGHPIGFANPLLYQLAGTSALHDLVAPTSPVYQVRTDFTNGVDSSGGYTYKLQTIDTQTSTLHDVAGYDDETGVGSPAGAAFFSALAAH